ncbi:MAG: glycosyltransferase family 2 protein [Cyclobacteriaceae bacterium]|nr:glycosyltransferase family 2 protein [Cyclobacteriaceae bacterium]
MYSIVIPVYNSSKSVATLVTKIEDVFTNQVRADFEIILVDDCSPNPNTWLTLSQLAFHHQFVKAVQLTRNFGQQAATLCGFEYSQGDYIITMDDDLQHRPQDIPKLILHRNHDVVIAQMANKRHSAFKRITSKIKSWFDSVLIGKPRHIQLSSFRLINRNIALGMLKIRTPKPFIPALMFYISKDIFGVEVEHDKRSEGKGNYTFWKMLSVFSNLLINNSSFLLRVLGLFGIVISLMSLAGAVYFIARKLLLDETPVGWTSVIVAVLFFGGILLFAVGIIGEYLIRIISGTEQKPTYIVRTTMNI